MISKRVLIIAALLAVAATAAMAANVEVKQFFYTDNLQLYSTGTLDLYDAANPTGTATSSVFGIVTTSMNNDASPVVPITPPIAPLTAAVATGYANGAWTGTAGAITNDSCVANPAVVGGNPALYALAPLTAGDWTTLTDPTSGIPYTVFHGVDVTGVAKASYGLVQFTYNGDLNLDGAVNNADLNLVKGSMLTLLGGGTVTPTWITGDTNLDGAVNNADLNIVKGQMLRQLTAGVGFTQLYTGNGATVASVPEPSTIVLVLGALAALIGYRKISK